MRKCDYCKWLDNGTCKKGFQVEPFEKLSGYKRPKNCTKKQESVTKKKHASDSWLNKQLDKLWSEVVRSKGECELCGRKPPEVVLHAHHIFSRRHYSTRWDIRNGLALCNGCHLYKAHKDIMEFSDWVQDHFGKDYVDTLRIKAHSTADFTKEEKREMIEELKKRLDKPKE